MSDTERMLHRLAARLKAQEKQCVTFFGERGNGYAMGRWGTIPFASIAELARWIDTGITPPAAPPEPTENAS